MTPTRRFYDLNAEKLDVETAAAEIGAPGNRYYCVVDRIPDGAGLRRGLLSHQVGYGLEKPSIR